MPTIRCVLCMAKQPHDTVFQFPRHALSQRRWMAICNVAEVRPSMGVCVRHFEKDEINLSTKVPRLSQGAVPSLQASSERLRGRVIGNVNISKKRPQLQFEQEASSIPSEPVMEPILEPTKDVTLPLGTYARLQAAKMAMKASSIEKTIEGLAIWFLRKESLRDRQQHSMLQPDFEGDVVPGGNSEPALPLRSVAADAPPIAAYHDLNQVEVLQEIDVQLESEDDPGACDGGADTTATTGGGGLCDGRAVSAHWQVASAVISEPQLQLLLLEAPARCPGCMQLVPPAINRISLSYSVTWVCQWCGIAARSPWHSTSASGQVATFDAVFAAAVTLSGCTLSGVQKLLDFVNMGRLRSGAFHRLTDAVVSPVIGDQFRDTLEANRQAAVAASPDGLVVAGSYQVDSPDFSQTFGTYTLMDYTTGSVVAQSTLSHQKPGSPTRKEQLESVRLCLEDLRRAEVPVAEFVSDRLVGAKKLVGKILPGVKYSYDVRSAAKHVEKRLNAYAAKDGYKQLKSWVGYLKNHFWWCVKMADGSSTAFRKLWVLSADHVVNVHVSADGVDSCPHEELSGAAADQPWLTPGSAAHRAVQDVVLDDQTLNMADQAIRFRHESRLEVLRAVDQRYTPRQEPCCYSRLVARKQAAVLDYSAHSGRSYARNGDGRVRHIRAFSRAGGRSLTRPVKVAKTYPHVGPLLEKMADLRQRTTVAAC